MKFKGSIEIKKPVDLVSKLFADPAYLKEYQDGFIRKELVEGEAGKDAAISKMYYQYGKGEMELTETIISNKLPDSFEAFYHHKHMDNTMKCSFKELEPGLTKYEYEYEYVRMNWVMPKLIAILFPSMYRKQGEKWIRQFRDFVEKQ